MKANLPTRRLIPKWRRVKQTLATYEVASGSSIVSSVRPGITGPGKSEPVVERPVNVEEFDKAVALWTEHHEPGVLGDILSFSLHPSLQQRIVDIGNKAIRAGGLVTPAQRFILKNLAHSNGLSPDLELPEPGADIKDQLRPFAKPIRDLRELLRTDPANSLALLDFAQLQAAIGQNGVAEKALRTALRLAPSNSLVLRTLARFYVHVGDFDRAYAVLRRHERTPFDPWLISSEIALADLAGIPSIYLAKGRRMLIDAGKAPPPIFTELAGSVAMAELGAGNLKKARELQRIALLHPTDNVAAQAVDRETQFGVSLSAPNIERAIASSAEAGMLRAWLTLAPEAVEAHALLWHNDEPFSSRPIQMLTAMFAYKGDTERALNWLSVGLRSDHLDVGLLINLAYVQARAGMLDKARLTILKVRRLSEHWTEPFILATEGLIAYHHGRFDEGDQLYGRAMDLFDTPEKRRRNVSTFCLLNQAIIALELQHPRAAEIVGRTNEALQKRPNPDAVMLLKVATSTGQANVPDVEVPLPKQVRQRLTSQWVFDPGSNTLTEHKGLTAPGAKAIVLQPDSHKNK